MNDYPYSNDERDQARKKEAATPSAPRIGNENWPKPYFRNDLVKP
jgi:hypothetical protein